MESILTQSKNCSELPRNTITSIQISSCISILCLLYFNQLGVGPSDGFSIADDTAVWTDFIPENDKDFELVKSYMHLKVKLIFDPPASSSIIEAMNRMINEFEWRLNVAADSPQVS